QLPESRIAVPPGDPGRQDPESRIAVRHRARVDPESRIAVPPASQLPGERLGQLHGLRAGHLLPRAGRAIEPDDLRGERQWRWRGRWSGRGGWRWRERWRVWRRRVDRSLRERRTGQTGGGENDQQWSGGRHGLPRSNCRALAFDRFTSA